jgi:steroid delta-isomerase-like uncharacterized protein
MDPPSAKSGLSAQGKTVDDLNPDSLPGGEPVSAKSNIALVRHLYAEIDKGNEAVLDEVFSADYVDHSPTSAPTSTPGLAGLKEGFERFAAAFADSEHVIEDIFASGDRVVVRVTGRGIHRGEYLGAPPTGKRVSMSGIAIYRIARGKVVEEWSQADRLDFMRQLALARDATTGPASAAGRDPASSRRIGPS